MSLVDVWNTYRKINATKKRSYPLIFYITVDNQVAVLSPYQIIGPMLLFRFGRQEGRVIYDKTKAVWFMGRPAVFVREGQLYPIEFRNLIYLQYVDKLAPIYASELEAYINELRSAMQDSPEDRAKAIFAVIGEARQIIELLNSNDEKKKLQGVIYAIEFFRNHGARDNDSKWLVEVPLDTSVLDMFKPREEDLTIVMAEMEKFMLAKLLTMLGLGEVLKKPSPENIMKLLLFAGLFLLGAYFFASYMLPGLMHAVPAPAPPAGVNVP
jgi:hypothetical protein